MGRLLQIICGCVLALGLLGSAQSPDTSNRHVALQPVEGHPSGEQRPGGQANTLPPQIAVKIVRELDDQAREAAEKEKAAEHEAADLVAQERAAHAATVSANWAGWGVFWAAVASVATILAAILAGFAWRTSNRALSVAMHAERAHVFIEKPHQGYVTWKGEEFIGIRFEIVNRGRSPAWIDLVGFSAIRGTELPVTVPKTESAMKRVLFLAPDTSETLGHPLFPDDNTFNYRDPLLVIGFFAYRDMFGERRETHFALKAQTYDTPVTERDLITWGGPEYWKYT